MIVAPVDFTEISQQAATYAADMALQVNMDLLLVHVCALPMTFSEVPTPAYDQYGELKRAELQMQALKERLIARVHNRIRVVTEVRDGALLEEIMVCCTHIQPFAVVIAAESKGTYERALFGGKTYSLLSHLPWPLIIVPPETAYRPVTRIGLACDLRAVAKTLPARTIREFVKEMNGYLHMIHVSTDSMQASDPSLREEAEWLQEMLYDLEPQFHFIQDADIPEGVCHCAAKLNLDLLIVIPKKHDLLGRIFHRSLSKQMIRHAPLPVMALHE